MNREGIPTVLGLLAISILLLGFGLSFDFVLIVLLAALFFLFSAFSIYFFRDPIRTPPSGENVVASPCDGKVIEIEEMIESEFVEGKALKISIFMSVFNVHVNYVPFAGKVDYMRYNRGQFFRADNPKASMHNVSITTGLLTEHGKLAFKQVTGMVARRLVNHLRMGDEVATGQKFGIIKFGSRMDIFLPLNAEPAVKIGDKVRAGETIIASFI
jgi:phosphatidylserine decarboxylase